MPDAFVSGQTLRRYVLVMTLLNDHNERYLTFNKTLCVIPVIGQRQPLFRVDSVAIQNTPGACFSKVPRTIRARKANCQTATHLF